MKLVDKKDLIKVSIDGNSGKIYGPEEQLEIIGWLDKTTYNIKNYVVRCKICMEDSELYADGLFLSAKSQLESGSWPCGCSKNHHYSEEQLRIICRRLLDSQGFSFIDFVSYNKVHSKLIILCCQHGLSASTTYNNMAGGVCPCHECSNINAASLIKDYTEDFKYLIESSLFSAGTTFERMSLETDKSRSYFKVNCVDCGSSGITYMSNLKKGYKPCGCSVRSNQKFSYLYRILQGDTCIGLKFGIAINPRDRVSKQISKTEYAYEILGIWRFESNSHCRSAETEIKRSLNVKLLSPKQFPDGWTETTDKENEDEIIRIYEKWGGKFL